MFFFCREIYEYGIIYFGHTVPATVPFGRIHGGIGKFPRFSYILFLVYFLEIEFDTTMWALVAVLFLGSGAMITWGLLMMRSQKKAESYL
jgi:hypothetical protein